MFEIEVERHEAAARRHTAVPRPRDSVPHSVPRSTLKSRHDHERRRQADHSAQSLLTSCCARHLDGGATDLPNLWPRTAASVTPSSVARLPRVCHTFPDRRLLSPHGRGALRGATVRRSGTASPDAVPQILDCRSSPPSAVWEPRDRLLISSSC